eukprot:SAG11_NODE_533_length_8703_cov_7.183054_1_plen_300_part_00
MAMPSASRRARARLASAALVVALARAAQAQDWRQDTIDPNVHINPALDPEGWRRDTIVPGIHGDANTRRIAIPGIHDVPAGVERWRGSASGAPPPTPSPSNSCFHLLVGNGQCEEPGPRCTHPGFCGACLPGTDCTDCGNCGAVPARTPLPTPPRSMQDSYYKAEDGVAAAESAPGGGARMGWGWNGAALLMCGGCVALCFQRRRAQRVRHFARATARAERERLAVVGGSPGEQQQRLQRVGGDRGTPPGPMPAQESLAPEAHKQFMEARLQLARTLEQGPPGSTAHASSAPALPSDGP